MCDVISLESRGNQRSGQQQGQAKDCSEWTYGDCTLAANSTCGRGNKKGVRTGDNCSVKEKSFPCRIPCGMTFLLVYS